MPRYEVEVRFTQTVTRTLAVYAPDEEAAEEKVAEIVQGWPDVDDVLDTDCTGQIE